MSATLAIRGGTPAISGKWPARRLFGEAELEMVRELFEQAWERGVDFGFQGPYEARFTDAFCRLQGGGYADAVSSGTAAVYVALAALELPAGCEVLVSPVTNAGGITPVVALGMKPRVVDGAAGTVMPGAAEFAAAIGPDTRAAVLTHVGGLGGEIDEIAEIAKARGVMLIEDCAQAHGTTVNGQNVGTFGDLAAFSTMFSKTVSTGGIGGLVYTQKEEFYWRARSHADRGKPFEDPNFDFKHAERYLFPALNFNCSEIGCAIGCSVLERLGEIIDRRLAFANYLSGELATRSRALRAQPIPENCKPSLFFLTIEVDSSTLSVGKHEFAAALQAEGLWLNPHYREFPADWPWLAPHLSVPAETPHARAHRDSSFNLLFHERFGVEEAETIMRAIEKVEAQL